MSVDVIIPTKNPNYEHLESTLDSVRSQTYSPINITLVDSSDDEVDIDGVDIIHDKSLGIGEARKEGILNADEKYVFHIDEDAVLVYDDHVEVLIDVLNNDEISCVGSSIIPLRGNIDGKLISKICNVSTHPLLTYGLLHERVLCGDGQCFNMAHRGEDIDIRKHMMYHGRIAKVTDRYILKDVPTTRQKIAENLTVGLVGYKLIR